MPISTPDVQVAPRPSEDPTVGTVSRQVDPAEAVARIAAAQRGRLLRFHRRRLRWEDLEDCYSQATLELVARSRRAPFESNDHIRNALEQKMLSRIEDKRRAIGGRSAIESAIARAVPVDVPECGIGDLEDRGATVESQVLIRSEMRRLREVLSDLTRDQQLVLGSQVYVDMPPGEFCAQYGWSMEKYRKVAQRARIKLRVLVEEYEVGDRCRRLEPDVLAMCAGVAEGAALARARAHVANCQTCARTVADLDRAARSVAALLPVPGAVAIGGGARLAGLWTALRRAAAVLRHPLAESGAGSGAGVAGGSMAGVGAVKVGLAAICVAGAASSYAVCAHLGVLAWVGGEHHAYTASRAPHATRSLVDTRAGAHRHDARRKAGATTHTVAVSAQLAPVAPAAALAVRRRVATRVSALVQIRREFGNPPARVAAFGSASTRGPSIGSTLAAARSPVHAPTAGIAAQSPAAVSQTQTEFGFEK